MPHDESNIAPEVGRHELLTAWLAERDAACPLCAADLRGVADRTCPKCGKRLRLAVGLVEPDLGPYLFGLVSISLGIGLALLLILYFVAAMAILSWRGSTPPMNREQIETLSGIGISLGVSCFALWLWIRLSGRVRRQSRAHQRGWAATTLLVPLLGLGLLIYTTFN